MRQRSKVLATATSVVLAFSVGMAGATHGGGDTVMEGSIIGTDFLQHSPCSNGVDILVQGVTQFIVAIPEATWNHEFALTSPISGTEFTLDFWAKNAGGCTNLEHNFFNVTHGVVREGATHALLGIWSKGAISELHSDFMLTIDNDS